MCTDALYNARIHSIYNASVPTGCLLHCFVNVRWHWSELLQWQLLLYAAYPYYDGITSYKCRNLSYLLRDLYMSVWVRNKLPRASVIDPEYMCLFNDVLCIIEGVYGSAYELDCGFFSVRDYYSYRYDRTNDDYALSLLADNINSVRAATQHLNNRYNVAVHTYAEYVLLSDFVLRAGILRYPLHVSASVLCKGITRFLHSTSVLHFWHSFVCRLSDS